MSYEKKLPGRASSQVSIYDYPEHLNPFYEDDHHKRLRFWKINSSSKDPSRKTGRSNSFTLSGLKDIWTFKSFKLKKKSSTLGVNKTSESPPELRRVYPVADTYNTIDSRSRHTTDIGLENNFLRGAGYRSSLQNVHSTGESSNGFHRNDRYRSTVQNGFQTLATTSPQRDRYVYSGSITPTPRPRYVTPQSRYGSSQTSINSTNPFEEDDTISRCESVDGVSLRKRKKRQAPQPPVTCSAVSINQQPCTTVDENSSFETSTKDDTGDILNLTAEIETFVRTHDNDSEKLRESTETTPLRKREKSPPIPPMRTTSHAVTIETNESPKNNTSTKIEALPHSRQIIDVFTIERAPDNVHNGQLEKEKRIEIDASDNRKINLDETHMDITEQRRSHGISRESPENNEDYPERNTQTPDLDNATRIRKVNSLKQLNVTKDVEIIVHSPPRIMIRKPTEDWEYDEEVVMNGNNKPMDNDDSPKTPISSEVEFILEEDKIVDNSTDLRKIEPEIIAVATVSVEGSGTLMGQSSEKVKLSTTKIYVDPSESFSNQQKSQEQLFPSDVPELKIVESTEDLTSTPPISQNSDKYKIRFVALKNFSPEPQRRDVELRPKNSQEMDVDDIDLPPAPPQRRRSVRDIIASINKSQSLLKINQKPNINTENKRTYIYDKQIIPTVIDSTINNSPLPKPVPSNENIIKKFNELDESERKIRKIISEMEKSSIDLPVPVERFDESIENNNNCEDLFKKCVIRRDKPSHSGASQDENRPSMEWNPLPKPRRSRNLTHEIENGKI